MSIEVNSFIDLGLKIDETNNNPKNILLLGNTKGFFGSCSEDKNIFTNACGDEETIKNNYFWLENEYNVCNSNLYIIGDTDVCNYYHHIISDMASMMGKKPKYKYMDINICAKKKGISEEKEIEKYYVNILKEQQGKRMKFDKIIMNPPYDKNLHLKIVEQAINLLTDDGILVNLSPIRWLQDPLAKYKKNSDWYKFKEVREHTHKINVVLAKDFQTMFGAIGNFDLGIYVIRNSLSPTPVSVINSVIERISEFNHSNPAPLEFDKYKGYRVRIPLITAGKSGGKGMEKHNVLNSLGRLYTFKDGYKDGKQWWEHYNVNQFTKKSVIMGISILFKTEKEGLNFINTFNTIIGKFYCGFAITDVHIRNSNVLWLGDAINPRTGLKGYESEWTDEDFRKYFDITDSEWEEIEETMKPYM